MSSNFERMASTRYPFTKDNEHNLHMVKMRSDYIAALQVCKSRPAYTVISPWGEFPCICEPFMPDDTKGWQTVRAHGRQSNNKKRHVPQRNLDDYEDY